jgi:hypothetical protein
MNKIEVDQTLSYILQQIKFQNESINVKNLAEAAKNIAEIYKY